MHFVHHLLPVIEEVVAFVLDRDLVSFKPVPPVPLSSGSSSSSTSHPGVVARTSHWNPKINFKDWLTSRGY